MTRWCTDRHRGVGRASPIYTGPAHAAGAELRRAIDDANYFQGATARHRRSAPIHGLPLHHSRPLARRISSGPLRRIAGRGADGRRVRLRNVPHHRGPDLRRHRSGNKSASADASRSPPAPGSVRPASALRVDGHHRRGLSAGRGHSGAAHRGRNPRREMETRCDRSVRRRSGRLFGPSGVRLRLQRVLALGVGAHGRRGLSADAPAVSVLRYRGASAGRVGRQTGRLRYALAG